MTVGELIGRLENIVERNRENKFLPVELMIERNGEGQWQFPCEDIALAYGKYVVLIYEDPIEGDK